MEAWLSATIKQDLEQTLGVAGSQPLGSLNGAYEDDGSNIRVKASKPGVVQIIKLYRLFALRDFESNQSLSDQWEKYDEPFAPWISDSSVRLKAIFAPKAAAQHENIFGKRITEEIVGNIIQLEEAEIVASFVHGCPRTRKITLLINKFKLIGSNTSAIGNPRPFDATHEFEELLQKLSAFRGVEGNTNHALSAQGTPEKRSAAGPRLGSFIPINPNRYGSQQISSQVPVRHDSSDAAAITDRQSLGGSRLSGWANNQTDKLTELLKAKKAPKGLTHPATNTASPEATPVTSEQKGPMAFALSRTGEADAPIALPKPKDRVQKKAKQKRIRSRDLRISKDQQDVLDSEDSWFPAKPGRRGPVANIPPAILEEVIQSMKAKAAKQNSREHEGTPKNSSAKITEPVVEEELEEAAETQPEVLISSQDWPASSPDPAPRRELTRFELPPNSGPTTADGMDLDSDGELQHDTGSPNKASSSEYQNEQAQLPRSTPAHGRNSSDSESAVVSINTTESDDDGQRNTMAPRVNPSDNESELETSVLLKLGEQNISSREPLSTQEVPATAIQPQESVLQVKRTPYGASGHDKPTSTGNQPYPAPGRLASPSKRRRIDESGRAHNVEVLEDQTHTSSLASDRNHDLDMFTSQSAQIQSSSVDETRLAHMTQQEAPWTQNLPKPTLAAVPSEIFIDPLNIQEEIGPNAEHPHFSPYVSKRRKLHKASINFSFSQDEIPKEDPSVTARRCREEFMARRKVSHPEAPTSPYHTAPGTLAISERDKNAQMMSPELSDVMVDKEKHSLNTFGTAGDPDRALPRHQVSQDNTSRSSQRYHPEATSSQSAASPHQVANPSTAVSEPCSSPELESIINPASQKPTITSLEQPHSVLENPDVHPSLNSLTSKLDMISSTETSQQSNPSGQAQSLPELMTPALSQSDLPEFRSAAQDTNTQSAMYLQFRSVYPEYHGSQENFLGMCRKIEQLFRCDRMEHKSLWDDFIIRYQLDYPQYLERCVKNFEDPKTYERFYRDEIDEPRFNNRVLLPSTLGRALPLGPTSLVASTYDPVDDVTTKESPMAKPGVRRPLSSGGISRSSPVSSAVDGPLSSRQPHITKEGNRKHRSKVKLEDSVKRRTDRHYAPRSGQNIDSILQSSSPSTPPAAQTRLATEGSVPKSSRRLPWLQHTATASEANSERDSPVVPMSRRHRPERPLPTISPSKDDSTSIGTKHSVEVTYHSIKQAAEHSRPRLLEQSHKAKSRGTRILNTPVEDANTSAPREPGFSQVDAHNVDEGWKDHPTSLQGFTKFYQAIKPGRGNSWARKEDFKNPKAEVKGGKTLHVMDWHL
ncbi:MAG: hypothetical protein L6R42_002965 [Xanthoria sp. 1 TBL-2021]|nr:MAG: hypothetical protein L6R42_002965 [Xanthoria sp. 1 TBL-2021]